MRVLEQRSPAPELEAITGLIPRDVDAEGEYRRHVRDKHSRASAPQSSQIEHGRGKRISLINDSQGLGE
jgi:hypothetical protein